MVNVLVAPTPEVNRRDALPPLAVFHVTAELSVSVWILLVKKPVFIFPKTGSTPGPWLISSWPELPEGTVCRLPPGDVVVSRANDAGTVMGRSPTTNRRNEGCAGLPEGGPANRVPEFCVFKVISNSPVLVIGLFVIVYIGTFDLSPNPTLVTEPPPPVAGALAHMGLVPGPWLVSNCPELPKGKLLSCVLLPPTIKA